jgi:hypothetical protein
MSRILSAFDGNRFVETDLFGPVPNPDDVLARINADNLSAIRRLTSNS